MKKYFLILVFFVFILVSINLSNSYQFTTNTISSDISIAPLTNTTFIVAWVDVNETDISFKVMDTNGSTILNTIDVDTTASAVYSRVSVTNINSTHFVIAYINTTHNVFAVYNTTGSLKVGPRIISATDGVSTIAPDISVSELGNKFVVVYNLPSAKDALANVYFNNGTQIDAVLTLDQTIGPNSPLWNTIDVVGVNNSRYIYTRHDSGPADIFSGVVSGLTNTYIFSEATKDANAGESAQVAMANLNNNKVVIFWYDSANSLVEYLIEDTSGVNLVAPTTINGAVGAQSRVAAATVRKNSSATNDLFVAAWWNSLTGNLMATVINNTGGEVTAPFIMATDQSATYKLFDITGRDPLTNDTLYPGTFTLAYTNATRSVFKSFYVNGTEWDGVIPSNVPTIDIVYPINGSTYNSQNLFFRVDTTGSGISECWYNFNAAGNTSFNCGSDVNITAVEGINNLTAYVNNTEGLLGSDSISFTVNSSIPLTISITSPSNGTISNDGAPKIKLLAKDNNYSSINYSLAIYYSNDTLYALGNNGTLSNNLETEITLSPALVLIGNLTNYKIIVNATDGVNNATSNVLFYTLTTPTINLISPVNNYWSSIGNISFSFSVYDDAVSNISCSLYLNGVLNQTNSSSLTGGTTTTFNVSGISEGVNKNWSIYCIDASNNSGSAFRIFNVDKTSPVVNWISDSPDPINAGEIINITANVTDNLGVNYVIANISGTVFLMTSVGSNIYYYEYNTTGLDGVYNYSVKGYDNVGNFGVNDTGNFHVTAIAINLDNYSVLNGTFAIVDGLTSANLYDIEYLDLNFSLFSFDGDIDSWYLNFTANGTSGCSLGNKQSATCYNYNNETYKWIQYIEGTETETFSDANGNIGDGISSIQSGSGNNINLSIRLDEHNNPNVFKWYEALYNFSDVKWQNETNQRITNNSFIKVELNSQNIPLDADQYRLDFRVQAVGDLTEPLMAYVCNSSYISGHPHEFVGCSFVAQNLPNELRDDGTQFRGIFTRNLIDDIGDLKYVVLETHEQNISKYYSIKTYNATKTGYTTHWEYSNDDASTWNNSQDGYETELNINWFTNGANPTAFVYSLWVNTTTGSEEYLEGNITWDIDPFNNYGPLVDLFTPLNLEAISLPYNVTFLASDTNNDNLNISLYLYQGGSLNKTIVTGMNQSNYSYYWNDGTTPGNYSFVIDACEIGTTDLFCVNITRTITLGPTDTCTYSGSGNWAVDCSDNCAISSNVDLLGSNISITGTGTFMTTANITNFTDLTIAGTDSTNQCLVYCSGGGCFK